jgi:hypothetical protein
VLSRTARLAVRALPALGLHVAGCGWVGLELLEPRTPLMDGGASAEAGTVLDDADVGDAQQLLTDGAVTDGAVTDGALTDGAVTDGACANVDAGGVCVCAAPPPYSHRYTFDETNGSTARDSVGGANATLSGFAGTPWQAAVLANGLEFDGVGAVANVGTLPSALRTLAFYVRVDSTTLTQSVSPWAAPTSTGSPNDDWNQPQNAYARDGRFTNFGAVLGFAQSQDYAGFDFGLSNGAQVRGIEVTTNSQNTLGLSATFGVSLSWNGGGSYTGRKDAPLLFTGDFSYGGATDTWGHAFTPSELGAPFRLRLQSAGVPLLTLSQGVDSVAARIHFAPISVPRVVMTLAPGVRVELADSGVSLVGFPAGSVIYVDGEVGSVLGAGFHHVAVVAPSALAASALSFGGPSAAGALLDGALDDVRIYDAALSASQVRTLYQDPTCAP